MENVQEVARGNKKNTTDFYIEVKDGYGNIERQLNFDNPKVCPRRGLIELIPLKERRGFDNRVMFRRKLDKETGTWIGIPTHIDPKEKVFNYRLITIVGRRTFDLSNDNDAKEWACIRYSPYLEGSPNQDRNSPPIYKVYDKEQQAQETLTKTKFKRKASVVADGLNGQDLDDMMRACGLGIIGLSETMKQAAIIQFAEQEPETFLKHWESPTRQEAFVLKQAVDFDIVQQDMNIGFVYRNLLLGLNEQEAVGYLKNHPNVSTAIETLVLQKKEESARSNKVVDFKAQVTDADLQAANDRIRLLEAQIEAQAKKSIEVSVGKSLDGDSPDPELDTLKARAKELKIKGWHLITNKEKLEKLIQKAESKN